MTQVEKIQLELTDAEIRMIQAALSTQDQKFQKLATKYKFENNNIPAAQRYKSKADECYNLIQYLYDFRTTTNSGKPIKK